MWKTFAGHCIYQSSQGIRVFQNPLYRWLKFNSPALQTVLNRYRPAKFELQYLRVLTIAIQLHPRNCCMLGLGGGGAAHALSPLLDGYELVIIESNVEVIEVAKRFFWIDRLKNIDLINEEASQFINRSEYNFSHLIIDLFTDTHFPIECNKGNFFADCKLRLEPGGILALNSANAKEHFQLLQQIQKQFNRATLSVAIPGSSNLIIFAQNSNTIEPFLENLKNNNKIKKLSWLKDWGYVAIL
ncbi:MAG: hypothetical protein H0U70_04530 [Tatlockia sp.]|nr:hypothetical protein [Tatlockia sp.]